MPEEQVVNTEVVEEVTPPEVKEEVVEEKKEEPKVEPSNEHAAAISLFAALQDPARAGATLQQLANMAGLDLVKKADQREIKKGIKELVKERLGDDNSILAESLGPLLEELITKEVEDRVKPIRVEIESTKEAEVASRIDKAFVDLNTETKGLSGKLEKQMLALMGEINPGPKTQPEAYIRHIYKLAKSEFDEAEQIKARDTKRDTNKGRVNVQGGVNPDRVKTGSKLPTIREAVEAAMQGKSLED